MKKTSFFTCVAALSVAGTLSLGCDDAGSSGGGGSGGGTTTTTETDPFASGTLLDVPVPESGRVWVDLDVPALADETATWELAFEGRDVFTNGGESGTGMGKAFGPLDPVDFLSEEVPYYPFLIEDEPGGAFVDFYAYDGSEHVLYSRYHVFGVRRADVLYKVQILGFYGDVAGAPVPAIYSIRYAPVSAAGVGPTTTLTDIDATAGGSMGTENDPSACVTLATGDVQLLLPAEAVASPDWDLCFRRAVISVNGGLGGPGGVEAVDLDREKTKDETLADVMLRTADSELPHFDAVDFAALSNPALPWTGDKIVSAFTDLWLEPGASPIAPAPYAWLVVGSDGTTVFLVGFDGFTGATDTYPGTVHLRVRKLKYSL
jgi:hypothetical protein